MSFWYHKKLGKTDEEGSCPGTLQQALESGDAVPLSVPVKPEPDLATKPDDIVGYCFAFACPKKHVQNTFESIQIEEYSKRQACSVCGTLSKPCVVKRRAQAMWRDMQSSSFLAYSSVDRPYWRWVQYNSRNLSILWNHFEFFHYLESPKRKKK